MVHLLKIKKNEIAEYKDGKFINKQVTNKISIADKYKNENC